MITILNKIDKECLHIDIHTEDRFYERQFITRKNNNHQLLSKFEFLVDEYCNKEAKSPQGLLKVQYIAERMNLSPNYLSDFLSIHTGQNTQQHIHEKLIEKAKERLSTTNLSVSEIAYALGFENAQSFITLFKKKTKLSPLEFRQAFN